MHIVLRISKRSIESMNENVDQLRSEVMVRGGGRKVSCSFCTVHSVYSANVLQRWLIISYRTKETMDCFGIRTIGSRCVPAAIAGRQYKAMEGLGDDH
jgi:hypothetical protein